MSPALTGLDFAYSELTPVAAACLLQQGFKKAVVGAVYANLDLTARNLAMARAVGFEVDIYAYLWLGGNITERVKRTIILALQYGCERIWLDLEDDGNGESGIPNPGTYPPSRVKDIIAQAIDACDDFPFGLYSGKWWWEPATGSTTLWADVPWWVAEYDGIPDLSVFTPFCGITKLHGKQYQGTHEVCGMSIDSNVFYFSNAPVLSNS